MDSLVNGISFKHLLYLLQLLRETKETDIDFLSRQYGNKFSNFNAAVNVFTELGILSYDSESIKKSSIVERLDERVFLREDVAQKYLIKMILDGNNKIGIEAIAYLSNFQYQNSRYQYRPSIEKRIKEHPIRNLLIELELVFYDSQNGTYLITDKHLDEFLKVVGKLPFSPADLEEALLRRREIGLKAELEIMNYERQRLSNNKTQLNSIRHMSLEDTSCGYDILSFESDFENSNRFIEVKAVSMYDYEFIWSRSEINVAKELRTKYYLYLLPVLTMNEFDKTALVIIKDPVVVVLESKEWRKTPESLRISKLYNLGNTRDSF